MRSRPARSCRKPISAGSTQHEPFGGERLNSYYGDSHILFDVSLRVELNEVVALLGRNGAGKSTTLKSVMGVVRPRSGSVLLDGVQFAGRPSHALARNGMQLVHEDRRIFGSLKSKTNRSREPDRRKPWPLDRIYAMFPRLKDRRGSRVPISPAANNRCWPSPARWSRTPENPPAERTIRRARADHSARLVSACRDFAAAGQTIVLVEQNIAATLTLAHRVYIINNGHIVHEGAANELKDNPQMLHRYLGV